MTFKLKGIFIKVPQHKILLLQFFVLFKGCVCKKATKYMNTFFWVKVISRQLWLFIVYAICSDIDHLMAARDIRKQQLPGKKLTGTRQSSSSGQKIATDRWCAPFWALGLELQSFDLVFSVDLILRSSKDAFMDM